MKKCNIGIIGCGNIAQVYINDFKQIYSKQTEVVACADIIAEKAKQTAEKFGIPRACTVEELLGMPEVDIVLNLTVPAAHTQINRQALEAGKHVYCEKPFALSMEDAKETVDLAKNRGLRIGCAPDTFMGPALQTCRKLLDEGWIGKPIGAVTNIMGWGPELWHPDPEFFYKPGGGPLMDMGPYAVAALVFLFGPMKKLHCFAGKALDQRMIYSQPHRDEIIDVEVFTHYSGTAEMQNGMIIDMNMSFDVWKSNMPVFEIYGTEGMLSVPHPADFSGPIRLYRNNGIIDELEGRGTVETKFNDYEIPMVYSGSVGNRRGLGVVDMAAAIALGRKHRTNEQFVLHNTEILLAFDKSAKENKVYEMQTTCERPEPLPAGSNIARVD